MNKKNIMLLIAFICASHSMFGARVTVYNETGESVQVFIYYGKRKEESQMAVININDQHSFNSGIHSFDQIVWEYEDNGINRKFVANIPSPRTMLGGSIVLRKMGNFGINFTKEGASSDNVTERTGDVINQIK